MDDASRDTIDAELERTLRLLGAQVRFPPAPDLSRAVGAYLDRHPRPAHAWRFISIPRTLLYPLAAAVIIAAVVLGVSPQARTTVASWFHFTGVTIQTGNRPPGPLGHGLDLGRRMSLAEAQQRVSFRLLLPSFPGMRHPDEIYLGRPPFGNRVSLVYRAGPGLPRAAATGAGLLITEFQMPFFIGKSIPLGAAAVPQAVDNDPGLWISGGPHYVFYRDQHGRIYRDTIRLAGNVLIWQHRDFTVRLEGEVSEQRALEIALSMTPVTRR